MIAVDSTNLTHEPAIRLASFAVVFVLMAAWELLAPRRQQATHKPLRWLNNLGLVGLNNLLVRFAMPITAIESTLLAQENDWGVFHLTEWPTALEFVLAIVVLDLAIYLQHVVFHHVPILWRLHRVHHFDLDLDVTSGVRFHTVEIVLSMLIKCGIVLALGASAWAVLSFEVLLNATAMFNHSNVRIPLGVDRLLRWVLVTPDMHRVHHSVVRKETDSNFGFNLPWWDRLFRTYQDQPQAGHDGMSLGLPDERRETKCERIGWMLLSPFLRIGETTDTESQPIDSET